MTTLDDDDKKWLKDNLITRSDKDVNSIKAIIRVSLYEAIDEKQIVTKDDIKHLPTKEEFYSGNDKLMKELKAIRENTAVLSQHSKDHSDEIEKLKKIHPQNRHLTS